MKPKDWLDLFEAIADELIATVPRLAGTERGAAVVCAAGSGGDESIYLDRRADGIYKKHMKAFRAKGARFSLLSEETGMTDFGAPWPLAVVDPVDGSLNAKMGLPYYATSIAVFDGPRLENQTWGYVANLANGDRFYSLRGTGKAFFNGKRIRTSGKKNRRGVEALIYEIRGAASPTLERTAAALGHPTLRTFGALALEVGYLAVGAGDGMLHLKESRILDFAGAKAVLEGAGGYFTDLNGRSVDRWPVNLERQGGILAAPDAARGKKILSALRTASGKHPPF